jgi:hypothetical protein
LASRHGGDALVVKLRLGVARRDRNGDGAIDTVDIELFVEVLFEP